MRVISPYRARARRVAHLFVCSHAGRGLPAPRHRRALLSDERRAALALPDAKEGRDRGPLPVLGLPLAAQAAALAVLAERRTTRAAPPRARPSSTRCASCWRPRSPSGLEERDEAISPRPAGGAWPSPSSGPEPRPARSSWRGPRPRSAPRPENGRLRPGPLHARAGPGADARAEALRPLDAREVRRVPVPLVRRPRAEAAADRTRGGAAHQRADRAQGARGALRATRPRPAGRPTPETSATGAGRPGS